MTDMYVARPTSQKQSSPGQDSFKGRAPILRTERRGLYECIIN